MNFCDFINKYVKTKVDYDKFYGAQCIDLFRQYCVDVCGFLPTRDKPNTGFVDGAKDLFLNYKKMPEEMELFEQVKSGYKFGDAIVWGESKTNKYGHVALVVSVLAGGKVLVLEQDGYKQDGGKFAVRDASNALGALRPRKIS